MSNSKELFMHRKVAETLKSILDNGDFVVETFNESILVNYMEALGYPIKYKKSLRNLSKDFNQHCEEISELTKEKVNE